VAVRRAGWILAALSALALSGCGLVRNSPIGAAGPNRTTFEAAGVTFRARSSADPEDSRNFQVFARPHAVNPEGAVQAARHQATRYCILTFGGSDIEWGVGPDTPLSEVPVEEDEVVLSGRCTQR
jgi:hypothetical protein